MNMGKGRLAAQADQNPAIGVHQSSIHWNPRTQWGGQSGVWKYAGSCLAFPLSGGVLDSLSAKQLETGIPQ
jgi:hypothetical protein